MKLPFALAALSMVCSMPLAGQPVNAGDIALVKSKVGAAQAFFDVVLQQFFQRNQIPYQAPKIVGYVGSMDTACAKANPGDAFFCETSNTIYYDSEFLARRMKSIGTALGTDGDYVPILVVAHELGHAAHSWAGKSKGRVISSLGAPGGAPLWSTLNRESIADCLAGAVTLAAQTAGRLDAGDLAEAERIILDGGDRPRPRPTTPKDILAPLDGHGDPQVRLRNFREGYRRGLDACLWVPATRP
jgi:predicted metalloprotease